jgi:hypothetical protein
VWPPSTSCARAQLSPSSSFLLSSLLSRVAATASVVSRVVVVFVVVVVVRCRAELSRRRCRVCAALAAQFFSVLSSLVVSVERAARFPSGPVVGVLLVALGQLMSLNVTSLRLLLPWSYRPGVLRPGSKPA